MMRSALKHSPVWSASRCASSQTMSGADLVGCDAEKPRAPCYLPCQSVLRFGGCRTRLNIRAAHVSKGLIQLSDGKTQVSQSWVTVCKQVSGSPCVSSSGICSPSLFRCPSKTFVSVFSNTLFQHSRHDGPCKEV